MRIRRTILSLIFLIAAAVGTFAQERTVVNDRAAAAKLLGRHRLSLQWISWDYFGTATVTNKGGVYQLKGEQKGKGNSDLLRIDGTISVIDAKSFIFRGTITTRVSHINNGEQCERKGEMTFRITGNR